MISLTWRASSQPFLAPLRLTSLTMVEYFATPDCVEVALPVDQGRPEVRRRHYMRFWVLSPGFFLRQRKNLNRHAFARVVVLDEQMHLLADWREPNQVTHLSRAPDRKVVGLHDDIAFVQPRTLGWRARADVLDPRPLEVTGGWGIEILKRYADSAPLNAAVAIS